MASEAVDIFVSRDPLCEATAVFLAVLAYPIKKDRRPRFAGAWRREQLRMRAEEDEAFGSAPILFRPSFLQMRDSAIIAEMKFGADNLAERKQAAVDRHKLFAARLRSRRIDTIRAFGVDERNNAEGRARMTQRWRDGDWGSSKDLDPVAFSRNSTKTLIGETSIRES